MYTLPLQSAQRKPIPPWQFEIRKIPPGEYDENSDATDDDDENDEDEGGDAAPETAVRASDAREGCLDHVYCHVLDWQAPRNHVFVPRWMVKALGLRPREVVDFTWVRLKEGGQVRFQVEVRLGGAP